MARWLRSNAATWPKVGKTSIIILITTICPKNGLRGLRTRAF
nr:MAG TPA: hypothetical protein [Caudoviricetes sp.]